MIYLPITFFLFLALILLLPILVFALGLDIMTVVFQKLNLSARTGFIVYFASLLGSMVNIPISKRESFIEDIGDNLFYRLFLPRPPLIKEHIIIAINLGGAVIPVLLSIYLLLRTPVIPVIICTVLIAIVTHLLARPIRGFGIALPTFVPPLLAALFASLFSKNCTPCVAYISGVLGTLIGADILNLRRLDRIGSGMMSIGGAGVFDGIFLTGVVAVLLV
ncbi:MAG: DUF1614 domain-containing protein [candidate division WOR-3 bacterium]